MAVRIRQRKRKRGTAVYLDYWDSDGARIRLRIGFAETGAELENLLRAAEDEKTRVQYELNEGKHRAKLGEGWIDSALVDFDEWQASSTVKESTRRHYTDTIKRFREYLATTNARRLNEVTPRVIIGFVGTMEGAAANTIHGHLTRLKRIFGRLLDNGELGANPFKHPDVKAVWPAPTKHERAFTPEEIEALLEATADTRSPYASDYRDFFQLLSETGMRLGEALMLRFCDVNLTNEAGAFARIEPHDGWAPKTKSSIRTIPLTAGCVAMLRDRLRAMTAPNLRGRVFPIAFTNRSVNQMLNRALSKAGIDSIDHRGQKLTVHSLRHGYATRLVQSGADPVTVRDLLGHESIVTTNRYFNMPRAQMFTAVAGAFDTVPRDKRATQRSHLERFPAENEG